MGIFKVDKMRSDTIEVSWNSSALIGGGVWIILIEAQPINKSLPLARTKTVTTVGRASITENLKSASTYVICVSGTRSRDFVYILGEIITLPTGELLFGQV